MDPSRNGEFRLLRHAISGARVVFDVGANIGDWTAAALAMNAAAQYHCFEPSVATYARLAGRHFPVNIHLNRCGLGAEAEERELFAFAHASCNSLYLRHGLDDSSCGRERVALETLDRYRNAHRVEQIDFMKIDVEGHELAVLSGAKESLRLGLIGLIQFEYGGTYIDARCLLKDIWELLDSLGPHFEIYKIFPHHLLRLRRYHQKWETFQYSNWLITDRRRAPSPPRPIIDD